MSRLATRGSQEDIERSGARPGDWVWLSDSEVIVGAQLAIDDRYGLVGVPDWDTIVHLDEEGAEDFDRVRDELKPLVTKDPPSMEDEPRILQLLTQLEHVHAATSQTTRVPGMLVFRRAARTPQMGKLGLGPAGNGGGSTRAARRPGGRLLLSRSPPARGPALRGRGGRNNHRIAELCPPSSCRCASTFFATQAEQTADDQFEPIADRVLALVSSFRPGS